MQYNLNVHALHAHGLPTEKYTARLQWNDSIQLSTEMIWQQIAMLSTPKCQSYILEIELFQVNLLWQSLLTTSGLFHSLFCIDLMQSVGMKGSKAKVHKIFPLLIWCYKKIQWEKWIKVWKGTYLPIFWNSHGGDLRAQNFNGILNTFIYSSYANKLL